MSQSSQTTPKRHTDATTVPLVILGASAFGEVASLLRDINARRTVDAFRVVAILDDDTTTHGATVHDAPVVGGLERWVDFPDASFIFLIGSHRTRVVRRSILSRLGIPTERFVSLIHPAAVLFEGAQVGAGCLIYSGAVIFNDTILEDFVLILPNSVVGAACTIAECALIASSVSIGSGVRIGPCCHIGAGAVINEGIELGAGSQVAMASFVVRPLPDGAFCMGNPAQSLTKIEIPQELSDLWRNHPSRSQTHGPS